MVADWNVWWMRNVTTDRDIVRQHLYYGYKSLVEPAPVQCQWLVLFMLVLTACAPGMVHFWDRAHIFLAVQLCPMMRWLATVRLRPASMLGISRVRVWRTAAGLCAFATTRTFFLGFQHEYSTRDGYGMRDLSLDGFVDLTERLAQNDTLYALYTLHNDKAPYTDGAAAGHLRHPFVYAARLVLADSSASAADLSERSKRISKTPRGSGPTLIYQRTDAEHCLLRGNAVLGRGTMPGVAASDHGA